MELRLLFAAVFVAYTASHVSGQQFPPTDVITEYSPADLREEELEQNPDLLQFAARTGERIISRIVGPNQVIIAQEDVNVNLDCTPWAESFPGGTIRWLFQNFDERDNPVTPNEEVPRTPEDMLLSSRRIVGGPINEWFNITRTNIVQGAQDSNSGRYTCSVCRVELVSNILQEICHNASSLLFLIGQPPEIDEVSPDADPNVFTGGVAYIVGSNFCLRTMDRLSVTLDCPISTSPVPIPTPYRSWSKDGVQIFNVTLGATVTVSMNFTMDSRNEIFATGVINPNVLTVTQGGSLVFNTDIFNSTDPRFSTLPIAELQEEVLDAITGTYTCTSGNSFGRDQATSGIRECGVAPVLPTCAADVIFRGDEEVAPVGCNVCIPEGSTVRLNCEATSGTEPINYVWRNGEGEIVSQSPVFEVTVEGDYNCTASNLDNPGISSASVLFFSSGVDFTATITNRFGDVLTTSGCERLRSPLASPPDICVLVGEQLDLKCINIDNGNELPVNDLNSMVFQSPQTVGGSGVTDTYQCTLNTPTPCGRVFSNITVEVFDPASVDTSITLQPGELGPGRANSVQEVLNGESVILACPTSGIDDPVTMWFRVMVDAAGLCSEVPVDDSDPQLELGTRNDSAVTLLTISTYNNTRDDGTYVCRTSNIVGDDAAVVVLRTENEIGDWSEGPYSQCNVECDEGIRVRSVTCRSSLDGRIRPDSECDSSIRPTAQRSCSGLNLGECLLNPIFFIGEFSACSGGCSGGFRRRDVDCRVPMTGEVVQDQRCYPLNKPNEFELCSNTCCADDKYAACKRVGPSRCHVDLFRQFCCWTCGIREAS